MDAKTSSQLQVDSCLSARNTEFGHTKIDHQGIRWCNYFFYTLCHISENTKLLNSSEPYTKLGLCLLLASMKFVGPSFANKHSQVQPPPQVQRSRTSPLIAKHLGLILAVSPSRCLDGTSYTTNNTHQQFHQLGMCSVLAWLNHYGYLS